MPLIAVLSSPHFLFLVEDEAPTTTRRAAAAQRFRTGRAALVLSVVQHARRGAGSSGRAGEAQSTRRSSSPKPTACWPTPRSDQFVKNFAGQWLKLRDVGVNPPAHMIFLEYDDHLETSMRGESEAFFAHILRNDLSVLNFIRSDFVTINERMARFYGIPDVKGDHFRVVNVPQGVQRGGVLTQASVLTVTSNGTRTSPVWRGVWILERLLGDPPPPPPPNAGDIPPAVPGLDQGHGPRAAADPSRAAAVCALPQQDRSARVCAGELRCLRSVARARGAGTHVGVRAPTTRPSTPGLNSPAARSSSE